jgi:hypothetical protein
MHSVVSTASGKVIFTMDGNNSAQSVSGLYKNRTTEQEYGSSYEGSAALWSFGRNTAQTTGFGLEDQLFDALNQTSISGNVLPRQFGDIFFRKGDFTPGTNGVLRVVTAPANGRAKLSAGVIVTSSAAIAVNSGGGANITGFAPLQPTTNPPLHIGDNLILVAANGSGGNVNVTVSCINAMGPGTQCTGLSAQGMVVTPAPGCIGAANCPNPATVQWQAATVHDFGLNASTATAAPSGVSTAVWAAGEKVWNSNTVAGQPIYWVCTASGTAAGGCPGAWLNGPCYPGASGVTQIVAGTNVTISPSGGTGAVTINASGGGGGVTAMLQGDCFGTASSNSTIALFGLGASANVSSTHLCTAAGVSNPSKPIMTAAGTVGPLCVRVGTLPVSSATWTVYDNSVATSIQVTITSLSTANTAYCDNTHTASVAQGDAIDVRTTTATSGETLANVWAALQKN